VNLNRNTSRPKPARPARAGSTRAFGVRAAAGLLIASSALADVKPHALFAENAVLQQQVDVPVWGTAAEGEKVTVEIQDQSVSATASEGRWMVRLKPLRAGGPFKLTIRGQNTVTFTNILVGEVWICSGQSNMVYPLQSCVGGPEAVAASKDSLLRLLVMPRQKGILTGDNPLRDPPGAVAWVESNPETVGAFGGVVYYFGRDLRKARGVPVGLIQVAEGSSQAQLWMPRAILETPAFRRFIDEYDKVVKDYPAVLAEYKKQEPELLKKYEETVAKLKAEGNPNLPRAPQAPPLPGVAPKAPSSYYNSLVVPIQPFAMRGVIWYQGENNCYYPGEYRQLFPALIKAWREDWKQGEFPFLFVQLPPHFKLSPEMREAQLYASQTVPRTAMVTIGDVGDAQDAHPRRKEPVGARLVLAARHVAYGEKVEYSGPVYDSMKVEGQRAILSFTHVGSGLEVRNGVLGGFTIAGDNGEFVEAQAQVEKDNTVAVWSDKVAKPAAVRYAWVNVPEIRLYNSEGLPATSFRTDYSPPKQ
jgi:sialate O-acetylesterase